MPLISVNIPESLSSSILSLVERLVIAVERIAGPVVEYRPPRQSTLDDYAVVTPDNVAEIREAEADFAARHMLVPGSPAYLAAITEFESKVAEAYGDDAVGKLPWNVRTGG